MNSEPLDTNQEQISLKTLRESLDLSQGELASRLNLSYRTIAEWESGRKIPRFDNAVALAGELGISLKVLAEVMGLDISKLPDDEA